MRIVLLCCAAFGTGCGGITVDSFIGTWTMSAVNGTNLTSGKTTMFTTQPGVPMLIVKNTVAPDSIFDATVAGSTLFSGQVVHLLEGTEIDFVPTTLSTMDSECSYVTNWSSGNIKLQDSVLTVDLVGTVDAFCSPNPQVHGTSSESFTATKDR